MKISIKTLIVLKEGNKLKLKLILVEMLKHQIIPLKKKNFKLLEKLRIMINQLNWLRINT